MGILEKLLPPKENTFFVSFEESAKICKETAELYVEIMNEGFIQDRLVRAKDLKHKSNDVTKEMLNKLNETFITPIDREDIQLVATFLNKITKRIVRSCVNVRTYRLEYFSDTMKKQAETLLKATEELIFMVSRLRHVTNLKEATDSNNRMREIETRGDEILYIAMDDLFSGNYDALTVIKVRDIYKQIENALDTCFSTSDEIMSIILKHS